MEHRSTFSPELIRLYQAKQAKEVDALWKMQQEARGDRRNLREFEIRGRMGDTFRNSRKPYFPSMNPSEVRCMCNRCHPSHRWLQMSSAPSDSPKFPIGCRAP